MLMLSVEGVSVFIPTPFVETGCSCGREHTHTGTTLHCSWIITACMPSLTQSPPTQTKQPCSLSDDSHTTLHSANLGAQKTLTDCK